MGMYVRTLRGAMVRSYVKTWQYSSSGWFTPRKLLVFFTFTNLIVYYDRAAISGSLPGIESELRLGSLQSGTLGTAFMIGYMALSPFFGYLERSYPSAWIMGFGLILYCVSGIGAAVSFSYISILMARIMIGVAEASYAGIAPPYVERMAPEKQKTTWLSIFSSAMAIGAATGYISSGLCSAYFSWRLAFIIEFALMALPSVICFFVPSDPILLHTKREAARKSKELAEQRKNINKATSICKQELKKENYDEFMRGDVEVEPDDDIVQLPHDALDVDVEYDDTDTVVIEDVRDFDELVDSHEKEDKEDKLPEPTQIVITKEPPSFWDMVVVLFTNRTYVLISIGNACLNFITGALMFWCPTFIYEELGIRIEIANLSIGVMTLFCGIVGTLFGGIIIDKYGSTLKEAQIIFSLKFVTVLLCLKFPLLILAGTTHNLIVFFTAFALSEFILFSVSTPINRLVMNVVADEHKTMANSLQILIIHLFGDVPSPLIFGWVRQHSSLKVCMVLLAAWLLIVIVSFFAALRWRQTDGKKLLGFGNICLFIKRKIHRIIMGNQTETNVIVVDVIL